MKIDLQTAFEKITQGEIIAVATDTVFGLVTSIHDPDAANKIYALKGRPSHKPLILLLSDPSHLSPFITHLPKGAIELMDRYWPGALTLIFEANEMAVHPSIRSHGKTIAARIPNCPETLALLSRTGPLASTSCNKSEGQAALSAQGVEEIFGPTFPVLDSAQKPLGKESTILAFEQGAWVMKRQGILTLD